jgi:hypothetical protein
MKVAATKFRNRSAWVIGNELVSVTVMQGGGHIASIALGGGDGINPLWEPAWKGIEPWEFRRKRDEKRLGTRLLASICGHNLCLGWFGNPTETEVKAGLGCHGEAPVARWRLVRKSVGKSGVSMTYGCRLPVAGMEFMRTISLRRRSAVIRIAEEIRNLLRRDTPYTMCEHVTLGPPFLEKGVTVFDMPATKGHTYPLAFEPNQRLRTDAAFRWPVGRGVKGRKVDLRMIGREYRKSSDFSTQLMDPRKRDGWFSAVNPKLGLFFACAWDRADFPWVGNWEENYGRKGAPWAGKSLTRGMEFANTPFPMSLKSQVELGKFHGLPAFAWLPARGRVKVNYDMILAPVPRSVMGVREIVRDSRGLRISFISKKRK